MILPYRFRQKAVTFAINAGNYDAASEIYSMPLDRFRHGIPPDVFRLIYSNRRQNDIDTAPEMRYNQNDNSAYRRKKMQEEKKMKIYEITISWRAGNGMQVAYAYCAAENKSAAKRKIRERIPYCIEKIKPEDFGMIQDADRIPKKASEIGGGVVVWYFGNDKKEHKEKF